MEHFPEVIGQDGLGQTQLFEHEVGTDQINQDGTTTTVTSFVKSYDFDIQVKTTKMHKENLQVDQPYIW